MEKYSVYVHIPFCKARCGYCAFSSCCDYSLTEKYFEKLWEEIRRCSRKDVKISTVYFGGGTPSSVAEKYISGTFCELRKYYDLSETQEITVECNPESASYAMLSCLKDNGVNRLSFGLQSVNDETLKRIGRIHCYGDFLRAVENARKLGFNNISADLIIGLPESVADFYKSVDAVVNLPLQHLSAYALELHDNSPISAVCKQYAYSDDDLADAYDYAAEAFEKSGFHRYEISNFAVNGKECIHNLNYWTECRYFAFGASACGFIENTRYSNPFCLDKYLDADFCSMRDNDELTPNEQANEFVMLGLRLDKGVSLSEFKRKYGFDFFAFFPNADRLIQQGYLRVEGDSAFVPREKSYVINSVLCELLTF